MLLKFYIYFFYLICYNNSMIMPSRYYSNKFTKNLLIKNNFNHDLYSEYKLINNDNISIEHIYPKSFLKDTYANNDMHNLYLTDKYINNQRSNYKYISDNCSTHIERTLIYYKNSFQNKKSSKSKLFIPYKNSSGIISRAIAYMHIIYPDICTIAKINNNVIDIELLKYWNNLYPSSLQEHARNKLIYMYQGNFNPFIENNDLVNDFFF